VERKLDIISIKVALILMAAWAAGELSYTKLVRRPLEIQRPLPGLQKELPLQIEGGIVTSNVVYLRNGMGDCVVFGHRLLMKIVALGNWCGRRCSIHNAPAAIRNRRISGVSSFAQSLHNPPRIDQHAVGSNSGRTSFV